MFASLVFAFLFGSMAHAASQQQISGAHVIEQLKVFQAGAFQGTLLKFEKDECSVVPEMRGSDLALSVMKNNQIVQFFLIKATETYYFSTERVDEGSTYDGFVLFNGTQKFAVSYMSPSHQFSSVKQEMITTESNGDSIVCFKTTQLK